MSAVGKTKWSLNRRILITSNLVSIVLMAGMASFLLEMKKQDAHMAMDSKVQVMTRLLQKASGTHFWNLDSAALQGFADELRKDDDVEWVNFLDKDGKALIKLQDESNRKHSGTYAINRLKEKVTGPNGDVIGSIELGYNTLVIEQSIANSRKMIFLCIAFAQGILSLALWWIAASTSKSLQRSITRLREACEQTRQTSDSLKSSAADLSASGQSQASAVQETAATLNEITAMVDTTVKNAKLSEELGKSSHAVAQEGKEAVDGMIGTIGEIDNAMAKVIDQVDQSNKKVSEILNVINLIADKTRVINDIVFQTKLLSFNASVEAARAGEHGKGFAVVAEEVGNLARMSGVASTEIGELLETSIQRVQSIIEETRSAVGGTVEYSKSKVEKGISVAKACGQTLEKVVTNASEVGRLTAEISYASGEQAKGVSEISTAMTAIDKNAHSTAAASIKTNEMAEDLDLQARAFQQVVQELETEVAGSTSSTGFLSTEAPAPFQEKKPQPLKHAA